MSGGSRNGNQQREARPAHAGPHSRRHRCAAPQRARHRALRWGARPARERRRGDDSRSSLCTAQSVLHGAIFPGSHCPARGHRV
jgi:hypothetical protein